MKLIRFGELNNEKPGIQLDNNSRIDVSSFVKDYDEFFFESDGIEKLRDWLKKIKKNVLLLKKI